LRHDGMLWRDCTKMEFPPVCGLAGRGRPPEAAARRAGLGFVEKLLTTKLTSADMTERFCDVVCGPAWVAGRLVLAGRVAQSVTGRPGEGRCLA
jgi:hypothetical protein